MISITIETFIKKKKKKKKKKNINFFLTEVLKQ
jgi:hypothetical protein